MFLINNFEEYSKALDLVLKENYNCKIIEGIKFYYDPDEITINEEIMERLG